MTPPLALDIDGTLTRGDGSGALDPRVVEPIRDWDAPVVLATGKAFPYPVALCHFLGIPQTVIAETGGIVLAAGDLAVNGDGEAARRVTEEFVALGHDLGWAGTDTVNRWRETEVAVSLDAPLEPLERLAEDYGLEVVDTGYAYHVKSPEINKGEGLRSVADLLGYDPSAFVAVGDSANDVSTFEVAGPSYAVANAAAEAKDAADFVTDESYADGALAVFEEVA